MKEKTLEQVAGEYSKRSTAPVFQRAHKQDFIAGAEWQSKKMYSEEEVLEVFEHFKMDLPFHYEFLVKEHLQQLKQQEK
jgi:hypothetical protein